MIPRPEQLETIARVTEGDLTEIPFAVLLHSIGRDPALGRPGACAQSGD